MENIKDYILQQEVKDLSSTISSHIPKQRSKISYETVFASGPDFAVRKKTPKTSTVLVIIVSKAQFYIKAESSGGTIQNLCDENLQKFVSGIPDEGYTVIDPEGNTPNWVTTLHRDSNWRELFLSIINNKGLHPFMKNDMLDIHDFKDTYRSLHIPEADFQSVKTVFNIIAEQLGREEAKRLCFSGIGIINNIFLCYKNYNRVPVIVTASAYDQIHSRWGIEGIRRFLTMFLNTPVMIFPDGSTLDNLFRRFDPTAPYYNNRYGEKKSVAQTVFELQSMVDYMFCECTRQGFADDPTGFWAQWSDYMNQQQLLFGEVRDKYSENLATDEKIMTYRCKKLKMIASQEQFQNAASFLRKFEHEEGNYCIIAPKTPGDLVEEGRQLSHCVGSYCDRVAAGDTYVFFLRKTSAPDRSLVTVQVNPDGSLGQIRGRFNRQPTADQLRYVENWHKNYFRKEVKSSAETAHLRALE